MATHNAVLIALLGLLLDGLSLVRVLGGLSGLGGLGRLGRLCGLRSLELLLLSSQKLALAVGVVLINVSLSEADDGGLASEHVGGFECLEVG